MIASRSGWFPPLIRNMRSAPHMWGIVRPDSVHSCLNRMRTSFPQIKNNPAPFPLHLLIVLFIAPPQLERFPHSSCSNLPLFYFTDWWYNSDNIVIVCNYVILHKSFLKCKGCNVKKKANKYIFIYICVCFIHLISFFFNFWRSVLNWHQHWHLFVFIFVFQLFSKILIN